MHDLFARRDDVIEDYNGTKVADPYRWLENPASADTLAWVETQNAITSQYISAIPARAKIQARMTALWDYPKYSVPVKRGDRYFFHKNTGLQDQSVLYRQDTLQGEAVVVIDPNTFSEDGTAALTNQAYSAVLPGVMITRASFTIACQNQGRYPKRIRATLARSTGIR